MGWEGLLEISGEGVTLQEGMYAARTGRPSVTATHAENYLGAPPTGNIFLRGHRG